MKVKEPPSGLKAHCKPPQFQLQWYHRLMMNVIKTGKIPQHIAFIMDGNRRYARQYNLPSVIDGHERGADILDAVSIPSSVLRKNVKIYDSFFSKLD